MKMERDGLVPGNGGRDCPANGRGELECQCEECEFLLCCTPNACEECREADCPKG